MVYTGLKGIKSDYKVLDEGKKIDVTSEFQ